MSSEILTYFRKFQEVSPPYLYPVQAIVLAGTSEHCSPKHPGFCTPLNVSVLITPPSAMFHLLYPTVETCTIVPFGIKSSRYVLPEEPTIGIDKGSTSSSEARRMISVTILWRRRVSYVDPKLVRASAFNVQSRSPLLPHSDRACFLAR